MEIYIFDQSSIIFLKYFSNQFYKYKESFFKGSHSIKLIEIVNVSIYITENIF